IPRGVAKQQLSVEKKSTKNRKAAVLVIKTIGIIVIPYSYCKAKNLPCKIAKGYNRCKEYTRRRRSYDRNRISLAAAQQLATEKERLNTKE
ncbi:hypothetical protein M431DRAFT_65810, partial [Trichoderma harzianum CBS 226.95]